MEVSCVGQDEPGRSRPAVRVETNCVDRTFLSDKLVAVVWVGTLLSDKCWL
jgi:hypothetical protein